MREGEEAIMQANGQLSFDGYNECLSSREIMYQIRVMQFTTTVFPGVVKEEPQCSNDLGCP
jgi:hypothetical protein